MSRIHEALQKAAERQDALPKESSDELVEEGSARETSPEAFPIELAERRRVRSVNQAPASVPAVERQAMPQERPPAAAPDEQHATPDDQPLSFERVDARYAGKVVIDQNISAESRERSRRLAASLHHAQAATGIKVVMLTSAVMGEGKTLTSSNLALTLSESYQKNVLLIDADLRRPALQRLFRIRTGTGLTEGLADGDQKVPVHQISSRLGILAAGRPTSDPIAGLTSARMKRLITEARESFDWIILDTPPVALLTDANLLGAMVDGAVIVVRAGSTPWDLVQRAVATIGQDRLLGIVLNGATAERDSDYYGYNYYTAPQETPSST